MKKILYTIIAVIISCLFYSCNENFLDTLSSDTYNEENWWQTESQTISSINGCYTVLRNSQIYGTSAFREENITPNSYSMGGDSPLDVGSHNSGNVTRFYEKWEDAYEGIGRVNTVLDNIDRVEEIDAELMDRIKGEAYFLRALFYYFGLVNYFGGVPLILEAPNMDQGSLPRNTRQEVVDQVLADLDNAASVLPVSYTGSDIGRATKGAALGLKARVLLYESEWEEAAQTAKEVINMEIYSLFPDYRNLFMLENEGNEEVIFDVQYLVPDYPSELDRIIDTQHNVAPTLDLVNSYYMKDGKPTNESSLYDPENPYDNRDPRLQKTVVIPGYMYRGEIARKTKYYTTGYGFKKYTAYEDSVFHSDISDSEINFIVLRYADILLMYAEAQNEANGTDASVYDALNQVRSRAGMPDIPEGLSQEEMREVIRHERRIELAGESLYYSDIRRWRIAEEVMNANVLNSDGEVVQIRSFNSERDYLWPIHDLLIQDNPALEQNPKY